MNPKYFISALRSLRFENAFNPYTDRCEVHDFLDAPVRRVSSLTDMLEAASKCELDSLWIGRDLGYRGGRRTGLAFTDDIHIDAHAKRWGISIDRATVGKAISERAATVIWNMLAIVSEPVFLWNVFPLHPHEPDRPFSNRSHNAKERRAGTELLFELVNMLKPKRLIAVGNDAEKVLQGLDVECPVVKVRHPSYGGQTQFSLQIRDIYDTRETREQLLL